MVFRVYEGVVKDKNSFFRAGKNNHIIRFDSSVDSGDDFPQLWCARDFGVSAPLLEKFLMRARFQIQHVANGLRFDVGACEEVLGRKFVLREIIFDSERFDAHDLESDKARRVPSSAALKLSGQKLLPTTPLNNAARPKPRLVFWSRELGKRSCHPRNYFLGVVAPLPATV